MLGNLKAGLGRCEAGLNKCEASVKAVKLQLSKFTTEQNRCNWCNSLHFIHVSPPSRPCITLNHYPVVGIGRMDRGENITSVLPPCIELLGHYIDGVFISSLSGKLAHFPRAFSPHFMQRERAADLSPPTSAPGPWQR